jgi:hypothetical protein
VSCLPAPWVAALVDYKLRWERSGQLARAGLKYIPPGPADPPLCFAPDTPPDRVQTSSGLSESCPKIGDVPKSPFPTVAALVPSAGTTTFQIELRSDAGAVGTRTGTCMRGARSLPPEAEVM